MTLLIGIPACTRDIRGHPQHATPARYGAVLMGAADARLPCRASLRGCWATDASG